MPQHNPFLAGNPVSAADFINRKREIRRVVGRILSRGQSSAITGEPRSGKTSLLKYLQNPQQRAALYGEAASRLRFQYFDVDTLGDDFTQADFWRRALEPLTKGLETLPAPLRDAYQICVENRYTTFTLEKLLAQMPQARLRLVLLIDEFDRLLGHHALNKAEFYGSLRSLASRSEGALVVVLASRNTVAALNTSTQKFSRTGSPYFNFLGEVVMQPFSQKNAKILLSRDGGRFTPQERQKILYQAGGHPYYLQTAASALWDAYDDLESGDSEVKNTPETRWKMAFLDFYNKVSPTIQDTWRQWPPEVQKALAILALDEIPTLLKKRRFHLEALRETLLSSYEAELNNLSYRGFIKPAPDLPSGWEISAKVMVLWIGYELQRALRSDDRMVSWLREQGLEGLFTRKEKEQFLNAIKSIADWLPTLKQLFF